MLTPGIRLVLVLILVVTLFVTALTTAALILKLTIEQCAILRRELTQSQIALRGVYTMNQSSPQPQIVISALYLIPSIALSALLLICYIYYFYRCVQECIKRRTCRDSEEPELSPANSPVRRKISLVRCTRDSHQNRQAEFY